MTERPPAKVEGNGVGPGLPYGKANLVALGWHSVIVAALYVSSLLPLEHNSCENSTTAFNCFTDADRALLLYVATLALLVILWLVSMVIAAWLLRRGQSAVRAGTAAAFASMVLLGGAFVLSVSAVTG